MAGLRDDLMFTAFALHLGFKVTGDRGVPIEKEYFSDGIPGNALQFEIGDVSVWQTSRGWRVARTIDGKFEKPSDGQFFSRLREALTFGAENWRDR